MQLKWQHIAEDGFSLYPSGLGAQQSSVVPLCYLCLCCSENPDHPRYREEGSRHSCDTVMKGIQTQLKP